MSDEVTRQMREEREEARIQNAVKKYMRSPGMLLTREEMEIHGIEAKPEPTLTERIDEHCRLVAVAEEGVKSPVGMDFDPQLAINEFRACKQDPAFSAWATKWAVRLCRALGAE